MSVRILADMSDVMSNAWPYVFGPIGAILALIMAFIFYKGVMSHSEGDEGMVEIAQAVRNGAMAYLSRQYKVVAFVFVALVAILAILGFMGIQAKMTAIGVPVAGLLSGLCGWFGMKTATNASARTTFAAKNSLNDGLRVAFRAGAVMGLVVVGLALLDISIWFAIWNTFGEGMTLGGITTVMLSYGMGASTQALFARVGGGVYTKAADVGADLVGKVEAGIPEDDPRNPATIADNVGDNVGDVAGMGADLYESYYGSILASMAIGAAASIAILAAGGAGAESAGIRLAVAPIALAGLGIVCSIIGVFVVKAKEDASFSQLLKSLHMGVWAASALIAIAALGLFWFLFKDVDAVNGIGVWGSIVSGLLAGLIIAFGTEYYTSYEHKPTQSIAQQAETGPATVIIGGTAVGMMSTWIPILTIVVAIICAFSFAGGNTNFLLGLYGVGIAAVGMLSTLGITLATDAYGPIADNAGGNAEMSGQPSFVRERTDMLDSLGNTTAATGKGFAIGSAALTALALLAAYIITVKEQLAKLADETTGIVEMFGRQITPETATVEELMAFFDVTLVNPSVLCGIFIGVMLVMVFCAMTMNAVGRAAYRMMHECRRQFGIMKGAFAKAGMSEEDIADPMKWPKKVDVDGHQYPDYAECVAISTAGAQREMVMPSILAIVVPVIVGLILGVAGVMGMLAGGLTCGFAVAIYMANAGGAWDNAKKYIEKGHHGGKGSDAHKAGVVGDTVGDPFKDTSGPSLNILIKLISIVSVVFAGLVVKFSPMIGGAIGLGG